MAYFNSLLIIFSTTNHIFNLNLRWRLQQPRAHRLHIPAFIRKQPDDAQHDVFTCHMWQCVAVSECQLAYQRSLVCAGVCMCMHIKESLLFLATLGLFPEEGSLLQHKNVIGVVCDFHALPHSILDSRRSSHGWAHFMSITWTLSISSNFKTW